MKFQRIEPPDELKSLVECYWIAVDASIKPEPQKIIPDGFPEVIFHFGDPYKIRITDQWELQDSSLVAGQISKYFFLENTGASDILGIKLKPPTLTQLFGFSMFPLMNKVIRLADVTNKKLNALSRLILEASDHSTRINVINEQLIEISNSAPINTAIQKAVESIFASHGMVSITDLCDQCDISERQLERLFKKYVGLAPKFFSRIIRFSYIFQVAQKKKLSWSEVGLESGFYDQAHFIKDFKSFSGEDPSQYFFDELNLANFFMKKI